jgi:transposase-like protein
MRRHDMARFAPERCPHPDCKDSTSFAWQRHGTYWRACDGREVQRFRCLSCRHTFSVQTFRFDFRHRKPHVNHLLLDAFVSKNTQRQASRTYLINRKTIAHRLELMGRHCELYHRRALDSAPSLAFLGTLALDELETFERDRVNMPLTMPVLVSRHSLFILDLEVGTLAPRGRKPVGVKRHVRRSQSSAAVLAVLERAAKLGAPNRSAPACFVSDKKSSYPGLIRRAFGARASHTRIDAKAPRNSGNPLFAVNLTFAMLRDGISRLVRRNWAHSKLAAKLVRHAWIWVAWRNYVRRRTVKTPDETAATAAMIAKRPVKPMDLIRERLVWS